VRACQNRRLHESVNGSNYLFEAVRAAGLVMTAPSGANRIVVVQQPVGICVLVTPWNFPAAMATRKIGPALAAGCAVVLKPAEDTPFLAERFVELLSEAGVPPGVACPGNVGCEAPIDAQDALDILKYVASPADFPLPLC